MAFGTLDLDTRFEYLIIYKDKSDDSIKTWTLGIGFKNNYKSMMSSQNVEILGVYKKLTENQIKDIINQ